MAENQQPRKPATLIDMLVQAHPGLVLTEGRETLLGRMVEEANKNTR